MKSWNTRPAQRRGIAHIWTAIFLLVFVGFLGLATDTAWVVLVKQQLHNAADASALAGAAKVRTDQDAARDAAVNLAALNAAASESIILDRNDANDAAGDVVLGVFNRQSGTFTPTTTSPNAVKVVTRRLDDDDNALPLIFGPVFGTETADVTGSAIAMVEASTGVGVIVLQPSGPDALQQSGNGTMIVNGPIIVNSSSNNALSQSGNGMLQGNPIQVHGNINQSGNGQIIGSIETGAPTVQDPFAGLPIPSPVGMTLRSTNTLSLSNGNHTLLPGRYRGGIQISGNANVTMNEGVYRIEGKGFKVSGNGDLTVNNAMIYNTSSNGNNDVDEVQISGNGDINWTPLTEGVYAGMAIFHDRTSTKKVQISGNGNLNITGTIYAASAQVQLSGNGGTGISAGGVVAYNLQISGNGTLNVGVPGGGGGNKVFLVY